MKNKQYKKAFKYFLGVLQSPKAIGIAVKKTFIKIKSVLTK
jgi:hypothetical protein